MKYPRGFKRGSDTQIAVRFPTALFKDIIAMARIEKRDFNAMVLELVRCGKLCLDESDKLEGTNGHESQAHH